MNPNRKELVFFLQDLQDDIKKSFSLVEMTTWTSDVIEHLDLLMDTLDYYKAEIDHQKWRLERSLDK